MHTYDTSVRVCMRLDRETWKCTRVRVSACVCVCTCMRACKRVCACARGCARVFVRACMRVCGCMCICAGQEQSASVREGYSAALVGSSARGSLWTRLQPGNTLSHALYIHTNTNINSYVVVYICTFLYTHTPTHKRIKAKMGADGSQALLNTPTLK